MKIKKHFRKPNHAAVTAATILCKLCRKVLRLFGSGGTSLPGKLALKLCPELLRHLSEGVRIIVVSGTNGKTTTCRLIEQVLEKAGLSFFANRSGANLLAGITAEFAANSTLRGKPTKDAAVIECDEAALKSVLKLIGAEVIVITNIFRDQLDRYGEVTHTLENLKLAVSNAPEATLCLNADDSLVVSLSDGIPNKCLYFGIDVPISESGPDSLSDAMYCIRCKHAYKYTHTTYGHLGGFYCPSCGYSRPKPDICICNILELNESFSHFELTIHGKTAQQKLPLPGAYNIYNSIAAAAALDAFGINDETIRAHIQACNGFGRMESFSIGGGIRMILVKNPAGFTQVIDYLCGLTSDFELMCCLNDRLADGTDISWIWDVPFERLLAKNAHIKSIYTAGTRAEEMWLRLKYSGIPTEKLSYVSNYRQFCKTLKNKQQPLIIVPTYTAMMQLRPIIAKIAGSKSFWE